MSADHTTAVDSAYLAARARREAVGLERCASTHRFYGMIATADRERAWAAERRAFAALCEWAPFELDFPPVTIPA